MNFGLLIFSSQSAKVKRILIYLNFYSFDATGSIWLTLYCVEQKWIGLIGFRESLVGTMQIIST